MRFNCLCLCILALILGAAAADALGAQGFSLQQSIDMTGGAFSNDYVDSLFGIGGMGTELSGPWFGPQFENTSSASSFLSEFYINTSVPVIGFTPVKFDVTHKMPSRIYFGSGRDVTYTQYQSAIATARGNELWIQKGLDWSAYAIVPAGTGMQFIAFAPAGGQADYYETVQTDVLNITSKRVNFYSGYNSMNFRADKVGRHILLFVLNNQPSNSIIVDVISQAPPVSLVPAAGQMPPSSNMPPAYNQPTTASQTTTSGLGQSTTSTSTSYQTYGTSYPPQTGGLAGDTPVTIQSQGMRGYQVFLDEVLIGTEGTGGDAPDGKFSFNVIGNQNHNVRVFDGQFNYPNSMYFQRGVLKIINVEAGTAVYI
ncbi:MAG: hypothetical protein NTX42_09490 [Methanothrix sp.]|nr:hypothetical protein [Methanothrix sp.]